jgi:fibronectin type 3 domain-containing protein
VYEYTAQSLIRVQESGNTMELAGESSAPVRVNVVDTFPPAVPQGLAAVFVPEQKTIDLSWEPDAEPDLAGYIVYRADPGGEWKRISGALPLVGAAYRDASTEPGRNYRYAISAIDQLGHESARSAEAAESVPDP